MLKGAASNEQTGWAVDSGPTCFGHLYLLFLSVASTSPCAQTAQLTAKVKQPVWMMNGSAMRERRNGRVGSAGKGHNVPWNVTSSVWPWRFRVLIFEFCLVSDITWLAEWMNVRTFGIWRGGGRGKGHVPYELKETPIPFLQEKHQQSILI